MDNQQLDSDSSIEGFFSRSGLTPQDHSDCYEFIRQQFPNQSLSLASCQGYCSMTILVGNDIVIQFRPLSYRLDLRIAQSAQDTYGVLAPHTKYVTTLPTSGLLVYSMERIRGISFKDFRNTFHFDDRATLYRANICKDFASLLAQSWRKSTCTTLPNGLVGSSIVTRLVKLCTNLPTRFQKTARNILQNIPSIEALPWVLTHGDIVAGNIMVDPSTGRMTGLVDWAEAERLPFGLCLYGLEEIIGEMTPTGFQYCENVDALRKIFWSELRNNIPELQQNRVLEAVKLSRELGVLLWHGIAFDNGAINRVVEEGRDIDEIYRLEAFLPAHEHINIERQSKI